MPLYKPSELNDFLDSIGAKPNKKLSQNFLIDGNIIRNIVKAAKIAPGNQVLEIGPGPGSLTELLLENGAFVVAVETDRTLSAALNRLNTSDHRLKVVTADALKVPLHDLYSLFPDPKKKIQLISNLPYHITTPLLNRFVSENSHIENIIVMVQEEMGRRMSAKPGTSEYGSLTVFLEFFAHVSYLFKVGRTCFYPAPKVDSAVIKITPQTTNETIEKEKFFIMTRTAFQQRRKAIRNSLKNIYPEIETTLNALGLAPLTRPEELSCAQFITLFHNLEERKTR